MNTKYMNETLFQNRFSTLSRKSLQEKKIENIRNPYYLLEF